MKESVLKEFLRCACRYENEEVYRCVLGGSNGVAEKLLRKLKDGCHFETTRYLIVL
jgi:hypothetical protein